MEANAQTPALAVSQIKLPIFIVQVRREQWDGSWSEGIDLSYHLFFGGACDKVRERAAAEGVALERTDHRVWSGVHQVGGAIESAGVCWVIREVLATG